jgi:hypothetical protein
MDDVLISATLNRELACLQHMMTVARTGLLYLPRDLPSENPVSAIKFCNEQNILQRVLTAEAFQRMVSLSPND